LASVNFSRDQQIPHTREVFEESERFPLASFRGLLQQAPIESLYGRAKQLSPQVFPWDIFRVILQNIGPEVLCKLSQCSRYFNLIADHDVVWGSVHLREFRFKADEVSPISSKLQFCSLWRDTELLKVEELDALDPSTGRNLLHEATHRIDVTAVRSYVAAGVDVDTCDIVGDAPLHLAVAPDLNRLDEEYSFSRLRMIEILIQAANDKTPVDRDGETPLHRLTRAEHDEAAMVVPILVNGGTDVNAKDSKGNSFAHICGKYGLSSKLSGLLKTKVRPDLTLMNDEGFTPFELALTFPEVHAYDFRVFEKLGQDCTLLNERQQTYLHRYTLNKLSLDKPAIAFFAEKVDIDARDDTGSTALHYAAGKAAGDYGRSVKRLVRLQARVDVQDLDGRTPLHIAAAFREEHEDCDEAQERRVVALLKAGADPFIRDHQGNSPLDVATPHGKELISRMIRQLDEEEAGQPPLKRPPLHPPT